MNEVLLTEINNSIDTVVRLKNQANYQSVSPVEKAQIHQAFAELVKAKLLLIATIKAEQDLTGQRSLAF